MRTITINNLVFGEGTPYKIEAPLSGFETPQIRTSSENYSGRDGGIVTGQYYSGRQMSIPGFMGEDTCADLTEARRDLMTSLPIRQDLEVELETFDGQTYFTFARVTDIKMDVIAPKHTRYKIELYAGDPNFYDSSTINSVIIPRYVGGGFILPVILPIIFDASATPTIVTNAGTVIAYPTITIVGKTTNPVITKLDTGETVELAITTSSGDVTIIDMYSRTVTLNGGNILPLRSTDSDWWGLDVGDNRIEYRSDDGDDDGVVTLTWRNAIPGF